MQLDLSPALTQSGKNRTVCVRLIDNEWLVGVASHFQLQTGLANETDQQIWMSV